MSDRPLIMVCNDDGIEADSLWLLAAAIQRIGDVLVVAPAFQQSGMGTAFTLHRDLQSERAHSRLEGVDAWQVDGTPTDAVIIGLRRHAPRHVDMVVSGINPGPNMGRDVLHSGTVAAALQGFQRGLPSVAVSVASLDPAYLSGAAEIGCRVAGALLDSGEPLFFNVNVPDRAPDAIGPMRITHVADVAPERLVEEISPDGMIHRRLEIREDIRLPMDSDVWAVRNGFVSVSPLRLNLTAFDEMSRAGKVLGL